jgi:hypothetical protein
MALALKCFPPNSHFVDHGTEREDAVLLADVVQGADMRMAQASR